MPTDPIGLGEIAEILGVSRMTASRYAKRKDFPRAVTMPRGRIWSRKQVERWASANLPLPKGPAPKKNNQ